LQLLDRKASLAHTFFQSLATEPSGSQSIIAGMLSVASQTQFVSFLQIQSWDYNKELEVAKK
jgi:hypothetical protein